jgi:hypothetical protein
MTTNAVHQMALRLDDGLWRRVEDARTTLSKLPTTKLPREQVVRAALALGLAQLEQEHTTTPDRDV